MKGRQLIPLLAVGSLGLVVFIAALRFQSESAPGPSASPIIELPAIPDLRRWPHAMQDRVAAATQAATHPSDPIKALGELAQLYFSNGFTTEATQTLQLLIKVDPTNGRWPYLLGYLEERAERSEAALVLFASAARLAPHYVPALIHQANLLAISGQSNQARQIFNRCLALPPDPRAPYGLAKLDFARGDEPAAIERLYRIVQQYPKFQEAHLMLADLLAKAGEAQQAAEQRAFLANGQSSPPDFDPYVDEAYQYCYNTHRLQVLGELRNAAQDFEAALPYLQRAVQVDPKDPEIQDALARTYIGLHRWEEAQSKLQHALQTVVPNDQLYSRLSEVLLAQNKGNEAVTLLLNAQDSHSNSATIKNALGTAYLALERTQDAIAAFTIADRLDPVSPDTKINLARGYLKSGDPRLARSWAEQALKLRPDALDGLALLTLSASQMNDSDAATTSAQELFRRSNNGAEYRPLIAATLLRAGNLAAERGEHPKAEKIYHAGLSAYPNDGQLHGALGMLYGKLHRYTEAKTEFETFLRLEPRNPLSYLLLGATLNAENKTEEAQLAWKTGLNLAVETQDNTRAAQLRKLLEK